jgi:hypothetical protein
MIRQVYWYLLTLLIFHYWADTLLATPRRRHCHYAITPFSPRW